MGSLLRFPLSDDFVERFPIFIETGYGEGRSLEYVAKHDFKKLYSIELYPASAIKGREKFSSDLRVDIKYDSSVSGLREIVPVYSGERGIFFWLDAHFPGGDYYSQPFNKYPEHIRLPLAQELGVIQSLRPEGNYFILIDDLRFYEDYNWGDGPVPKQFHPALPKNRSLDFLKPFENTHKVEIILQDSGYALIGPHDAPWLRFVD